MVATKTRSQWVHRHPERGWEPCGKKQAENVCPFGEANHVTLEDGVDADEAAGRLNEHEYGDGNSSAKPKKRKTAKVVNGIDRSKVTYVDWDKIDNLGYTSSHVDMEAVGAEVNAEVVRRLGYDPADLDYHELKDSVADIQKTNREVMAEVVKTTGAKHGAIYGPRAKDLEESIFVLPDDAKSYISELNIQAKTMNRNNMTTLGQHSFGRVPVGEEPRKTEMFDGTIPKEAPEGDIFADKMIFEMDEAVSFRAHVKDTSEVSRTIGKTNAYKMKDVWVGEPRTESGKPTKRAPKGWRKISDTTDVWVNKSWEKDGPISEKITVNKPSYEIVKEVTADGSVLKVPAVDSYDSPDKSFMERHRNSQKSVALHEYTHAVQRKYRLELTDVTKAEREKYFQDYRDAKDKERIAAKEFGINSSKTKEFTQQVETAGEKLYLTDFSQEEILWGEIRKDRIDKNFNGTTDTRFEGFPDSYMGDSSKKELWTVATENFFCTDATRDNASLYGKKKAENPNTERIRNWIVGQWIQVAQLGEKKNQSD